MTRSRQSKNRSDSSQKKFVFTAAVMGLASIFFGMQLMMVGPLKRSLENIQSRLDLAEMDMRKLVSARNQVWQTNDLLTSLTEQHSQVAAARQTLADVQKLHAEVKVESNAANDALVALQNIASVQEKLIAQADSTRSALAEIDQLLAMKSSLVQKADSTQNALKSLAGLETVRQTAIDAGDKLDIAKNNITVLASIKNNVVDASKNVSNASDNLKKLVALKDGINDGTIDIDEAKNTGEKLVALNNRLITGANVDDASKNAESLIALGSKLANKKLDTKAATTNLASLVSIQEGLSSRTTEIASAVESLEIVSDFRSDIDQHIRSLDGIRRTMVEIVMLETTVGRAARILRPLVELGNLRRLSDGEIRQAAKAILADRTTRLSQKKTDLQGARSNPTTVPYDAAKEQSVPLPRDLEEDEVN